MPIPIPLSSHLSPLLITKSTITSLVLYAHSLSLLSNALSYETKLELIHTQDIVDESGMGIDIVPPPREAVKKKKHR